MNFGGFYISRDAEKILRPMVKDLAELDSPFLSYGQKTANFLGFWIFEVVIHPEMHNKILRPMVKDLAWYNSLFLSYSQITVKFYHLKNNDKKWQLFGYN